VAELVDALDLGSSGATRESSSLSFHTIRRTAGRQFSVAFSVSSSVSLKEGSCRYL